MGLIKRLAYRSRDSQSRLFLSKFYMTFVRPRLEYASAVWGSSCTSSDALYFERVQNSIARTIVRSSNSTEDVPVRSSAALKHLGWPTLAWRRRLSCLRFLWQLLHGEGPPQLSRSLPRTANARWDYQLRRAESLEFPSALRPDTGTLYCRIQLLLTMPCLLMLCLRLVSLLFFSLLIGTLHTISIVSVFRSLFVT